MVSLEWEAAMSQSDDRIKAIVREHLATWFDDIEITSINVRHVEDEDGVEFLAISVVFDGKKKQLDAAKTSKVVRHVRPKMRAAGENAFPVFSFIAKSELGKLSPEAA